MASCKHVEAYRESEIPAELTAVTLYMAMARADLRAAWHPPTPTQPVYREDCTQCFDSIDDPTGLDVCLACFNGGCTGDRKHAHLHAALTTHPLALNIRRVRRVIDRDEPPPKITKLAIIAETEADKYDYVKRLHCYECNTEIPTDAVEKFGPIVERVMQANTFSQQQDVKAWEQEYTSCEHILLLQQESSRQIQSQTLGHCSSCDLKENLWLCLQCGNLGCGRAQFGGVGGNSHALAHKDGSGHAVAVKLGSITSDGTADVYCYACDEERIDNDLGVHLAHWGILIASRQKTEKSLTEMNLEQNLRWEFSMIDEDGQELEKLFGRDFTGLKNLGNSCYLASTMQCLFALPQFRTRYDRPTGDVSPAGDPGQDLETQLRKLADGLISGRYAMPAPSAGNMGQDNSDAYQEGLKPSMFKALVGIGHAEFSSGRQQDAFEFLLHIIKLITRSKHTAPLLDPTAAFRFLLEQRLQCLACKKVRYRTDEQDNISIAVPVTKRVRSPSAEAASKDGTEYESVTLQQCLDIFTSEEPVELTCPACDSRAGFTKRATFKTLPDILVVNARRFVLVNWVPTKVDVPVVVSDETISMDKYVSPTRPESEELLPEDEQPIRTSFVANPEAMQQLQAMGFPDVRCMKALQATGNSDPNAAMEWLFSHMDDPDIDVPISTEAATTTSSADPEHVETLAAMGFRASQAERALQEAGGNMERAIEWLFSHPDDLGADNMPSTEASASEATIREPGDATCPANYVLHSMVCHKGTSIHTGHYVAFVRKQIEDGKAKSWVLYNDEKVVRAHDVEEMKKFAYLYFFERIRS